MGMVSINIEAMREMVAGVVTAQSRVNSLKQSLDACVRDAQWHVKKAPAPIVSTSRLDQVWWWLENQKPQLRIRLELAQLLADTNTGLHGVDIDESWLDFINVGSSAADVNDLLALLTTADIAKIQDILDRHHSEILAADGSTVTFYDPVFGQMLATRLTPTQLAQLLDILNQGGEHTNASQYDDLLRSVAGVLSAGARAMTPDEVDAFTTAWAAMASIGPEPDPSPQQSPIPPGQEGSPQDFAHTGLPIQLLSLVIARGQWPDTFLTGIYDAIITQEGDVGANHWLHVPRFVWDPGVPDPATGGYAIIADPMWGIFNTAVNNPNWVLTTFGTGDTTTLSVSDPDTPTHTSTGYPLPPHWVDIDVTTALYRLLDRGTADPGTATALLSMLTTADMYQVATGRQPTLLPHIEPILDDIQKIHDLSDTVHTILDIISFLPGIGEIADLINGILYSIEHDTLNATLSFTSILLISAAGLAVATPHWIKRITTGSLATDSATATIKVGRGLSDLTAAELDALENMVRTHTATQLDTRIREIYTQMDELGLVSNTARKKYLNEHLGPAYSTVYNPHTGQFHTAVNNPVGDLPTNLDPRLKERIDSMPKDIQDAIQERGGGIGTHAEVSAVNEALKADPSLTLEDLIIDTRRTGVDPKNPAGTDFVACPHCAWILQGTTIITE